MQNDYSMENLPKAILMLILIGMIVGVGVLILDVFGDNTFYPSPITNESFTAPGENLTVALANDELITFTKVAYINGTAISSSAYSVDLATGVLNNTDNSTLNTTTTYYAYYTYKDRVTATNTALDGSRDAVADISNTWLALLVTVLILAVILYYVLHSFGIAGRRT